MNLYQQERAERREWRVGSLVITLISIVLLSLALASCRPDEVKKFEKAKTKYATEVVDTTIKIVEVTVPRDSVVTIFKTDTTHFVERVKQGRATLTIVREPTNTTVIANCDSASRKERVVVKTVTQKWGVDPSYKESANTWEKSANTWKNVTIVLLFVIALIGAFAYFFFKFFRKNGNA